MTEIPYHELSLGSFQPYVPHKGPVRMSVRQTLIVADDRIAWRLDEAIEHLHWVCSADVLRIRPAPGEQAFWLIGEKWNCR